MSQQPFQFVLAGGIPSSGSTLLSVLLDAHSDVCCGPETTLFCHPGAWQAGQAGTEEFLAFLEAGEARDGFITWSYPDSDALGFYDADLNSVRRALRESSTMSEFAQRFYRASSGYHDESCVIEKTPQNLYAINAFLHAVPGSKAILTVRSPAGIVPSLIRRGVNPVVAASIWLWDAAIIRSIAKTYPKERVCVVRYEDLVKNPAAALRTLCGFLGIVDEAETMIARKGSDRAKKDKSLQENGSNAASTWRHSPLGEIVANGANRPVSSALPAEICWILGSGHPRGTELTPYTGHKDASPKHFQGRNLNAYFGYERPKVKGADYVLDGPLTTEAVLNRYERFYLGKIDVLLKQPTRLESLRMAWLDVKPATVRFVAKVAVKLLILIPRVAAIVARAGHILSRAFAFGANAARFASTRTERFFSNGRAFVDSRSKRLRGWVERRSASLSQEATRDSHAFSSEFSVAFHEYAAVPLSAAVDYAAVGVIAFQGRHAVLEIVVRELLKVNERWDRRLGVVLAASDEADINFAARLRDELGDIGIVMTPNNPLGRKWQRAVDCARVADPDFLFITGSDDVLSASFVIKNVQLMERQELGTIAMAAPRTWLLLDTTACSNEQDAVFWQISYKNSHHLMPLGAGRIYSKAFLDKVDGQIFDCALDRLLDDQGYNLVLAHSGVIYTTTLDDGFVLSVKGAWNSMNPTNVILEADSIAAGPVEAHFADWIKSELGDTFHRIEKL